MFSTIGAVSALDRPGCAIDRRTECHIPLALTTKIIKIKMKNNKE
jgi:hypothetical protein